MAAAEYAGRAWFLGAMGVDAATARQLITEPRVIAGWNAAAPGPGRVKVERAADGALVARFVPPAAMGRRNGGMAQAAERLWRAARALALTLPAADDDGVIDAVEDADVVAWLVTGEPVAARPRVWAAVPVNAPPEDAAAKAHWMGLRDVDATTAASVIARPLSADVWETVRESAPGAGLLRITRAELDDGQPDPGAAWHSIAMLQDEPGGAADVAMAEVERAGPDEVVVRLGHPKRVEVLPRATVHWAFFGGPRPAVV